MAKKHYELSIVLPSYNEVRSLPYLIEKYRVSKQDINFQLVIVDNGSSDGTQDFLKKELSKKKNDFIKRITIKKNIGYGNGIHQGLKECDGEVIGWSHADLQCPPKDVFRGYNLYKKINNKFVFVKGERKGRDWKSLILTHGLTIYANLVLLRRFNDHNGQPKIFNKELLTKFKNPPKGFSYDLYSQYIGLKNNYKVYSFDVIFENRKFGVSKWAYSVFSRFDTIRSFLADIIRMRLGIIK